ncbi:transporter substrate-binding domain-containing protein [Paucibacter sp. TC2R-5]|uniref:substrate-binding periplasmic protein n=1 Tax=Paucibacter sp. TC2R-5 TaxID=2893555 RepID=UPI0021E470CA|nr:transporter substrate-binding domain-containing protein [Paucibacter sp. TC2R-5]MCV2358972.1 transporter substrate-binding domain-containing protein [Paucibacter sp. TC2R-5]
MRTLLHTLGQRPSRNAYLCLLLLGLPLPLLAQDRASQELPVLQVAVSRSLAPPFVIWRDNQAVGGIDVEIAQAVAAQLKTQVEFIALPRLRVESALSSGEADMACNLSPLHLPKGEVLAQSADLFELQEMLAGNPGAPAVDKPEQINPGSVLGTLQAQAYPALEPFFAQGRLKRDDALDDERLLLKLTKDRHPYGISNRQVLSWFAAQGGENKLASWRLPLASRPYRCTFSPRGRYDARQLYAALEQLQTNGRIAQINTARSSPAVAVVVSVQSGVRDVSRSALVDLFMGQSSLLGAQLRAEPVMSMGAERQYFLGAVLQREAAQFRSAWAGQQFGGRRRAPLELGNAEAMKTHLQAHAQAVGFLPLSLVDSSLRIIYLP